MTQQLTQVKYQKLLTQIRNEIQRGANRISRFVNYQKVETNWRVGKLIVTNLYDKNGRAVHGDGVSISIAKDLGVSLRTIHHVVKFYRCYPKLPLNTGLTWTHYRLLLGEDDAKQRKKLEQKIIKDKITTKQLSSLKRRVKVKAQISKDPSQLTCERGHVYVYRLINSKDFHNNTSELLVDCGFNTNTAMSTLNTSKYQSNDYVRSEKVEGGYKLVHTKLKKDALYTFKAYVERVIDGDTLVTNIDCGFDIWMRHHLRLRGINTPPLRTAKGKQAYEYVKAAMSAVSFIIIKTYKQGKYGRYIADIFYQPNVRDPQNVASQGNFLNQELLDQGLANKVNY